MRILLLSAYDAASHRGWYECLQQGLSQHDWTVLSLPARHFSWRIRGNSLSWAFGEQEVLQAEYDLLIATSMVDLSALRGFQPQLAAIPTLVYCHENQFAYPESGRAHSSVEPQLLSIYTALAADQVVFNSAYNRDSFLEGAKTLLARFPDAVPAGLIERLQAKSQLLPVPLPQQVFRPSMPNDSQPLEVVWNHRWEYDKGPERLLALVQELLNKPISMTLHIVGQQFRRQPEAFAEIQRLLADHGKIKLASRGFLPETAYRQLLQRADVVISTALHDFQGLAVLEAVAAGCLPLVPDRLCYGEWFDETYRYDSYIGESNYLAENDGPGKSYDLPESKDLAKNNDAQARADEAKALAARLKLWAQEKAQGGLPPAPDIRCFAIEQLALDYQQLFETLIARHKMFMAKQ